MTNEPLRILVSPLDWGLGHASRCIPVIKKLVQYGHHVTIAGNGRSLILLQKEFPTLECIELKGFSPSYPDSGKMALHLLFLLPNFISSIIKEHCELKKLNECYHFDVIISDNRYGLWKSDVRSILITHQVMIKTPKWLRFTEFILFKISVLLISRFDECWIPDYKEAPGLSGDLSHKYKLPRNASFIGPLSRFEKSQSLPEKNLGTETITAIISGPEPQRSIFEELVTCQFRDTSYFGTIISGKPESEKALVVNDTITIRPHLPVDEFCNAITNSSLIICRSGYSSIMDLHALNAKVLFVPTPGQTEQMYLAELHKKEENALWREQKNLNLKTDIPEALKFRGFMNFESNPYLNDFISGLKKK